MNRQFTFENQNFQPDYMAFKFQRLDPFEEKQILDYLFKVGFNIYSELPPKHHSVRNHSKNRFKIYITKDIPFWQGTVIHFTGENGNYFYTLLKQKSIEWIFFNEATLARFDLCYLRENKKTDKIPSSEFFIACFDKIRRTYRNVTLEKNNAGLIEKVGRRKSYRCFRIYEKQESKIKFEYELKGRASEEYHSLLVSNRFEDLEHKLSLEFLEKFGKLLALNYPYLDWLLVQLRPLRNQEVTERSVKTDYITIMDPNLLTHHKHFYNLLQFLTYVQDLEYQVGDLGSTSYRQVKFRVRDFLKYTKESQNYYQLKELLQFFDYFKKTHWLNFLVILNIVV